MTQSIGVYRTETWIMFAQDGLIREWLILEFSDQGIQQIPVLPDHVFAAFD